jgi:Leucine-rich repeat (LRR) protein
MRYDEDSDLSGSSDDSSSVVSESSTEESSDHSEANSSKSSLGSSNDDSSHHNKSNEDDDDDDDASEEEEDEKSVSEASSCSSEGASEESDSVATKEEEDEEEEESEHSQSSAASESEEEPSESQHSESSDATSDSETVETKSVPSTSAKAKTAKVEDEEEDSEASEASKEEESHESEVSEEHSESDAASESSTEKSEEEDDAEASEHSESESEEEESHTGSKDESEATSVSDTVASENSKPAVKASTKSSSSKQKLESINEKNNVSKQRDDDQDENSEEASSEASESEHSESSSSAKSEESEHSESNEEESHDDESEATSVSDTVSSGNSKPVVTKPSQNSSKQPLESIDEEKNPPIQAAVGAETSTAAVDSEPIQDDPSESDKSINDSTATSVSETVITKGSEGKSNTKENEEALVSPTGRQKSPVLSGKSPKEPTRDPALEASSVTSAPASPPKMQKSLKDHLESPNQKPKPSALPELDGVNSIIDGECADDVSEITEDTIMKRLAGVHSSGAAARDNFTHLTSVEETTVEESEAESMVEDVKEMSSEQNSVEGANSMETDHSEPDEKRQISSLPSTHVAPVVVTPHYQESSPFVVNSNDEESVEPFVVNSNNVDSKVHETTGVPEATESEVSDAEIDFNKPPPGLPRSTIIPDSSKEQLSLPIPGSKLSTTAATVEPIVESNIIEMGIDDSKETELPEDSIAQEVSKPEAQSGKSINEKKKKGFLGFFRKFVKGRGDESKPSARDSVNHQALQNTPPDVKSVKNNKGNQLPQSAKSIVPTKHGNDQFCQSGLGFQLTEDEFKRQGGPIEVEAGFAIGRDELRQEDAYQQNKTSEPPKTSQSTVPTSSTKLDASTEVIGSNIATMAAMQTGQEQQHPKSEKEEAAGAVFLIAPDVKNPYVSQKSDVPGFIDPAIDDAEQVVYDEDKKEEFKQTYVGHPKSMCYNIEKKQVEPAFLAQGAPNGSRAIPRGDNYRAADIQKGVFDEEEGIPMLVKNAPGPRRKSNASRRDYERFPEQVSAHSVLSSHTHDDEEDPRNARGCEVSVLTRQSTKSCLDPPGDFLAKSRDVEFGGADSARSYADIKEKRLGKKDDTRFWKIIAVVFLALLGILIGTAIGVMATKAKKNKDVPVEDEPPVPSMAPDLTPTLPTGALMPTLAPMENQETYDLICKVSSNCANMLDETTAQGKAFSWLVNEAINPETLSVTRKIARYSLVTFYYSTLGESWANSTGWLTEQDECTWFTTTEPTRTVCNSAGDIVSFELDNNNVRGSIPSELGLLTQLLSISLENPRGSAPSMTGDLKSFLGTLTKLTSLTITGNTLTGGIPSNFGVLTQLERIDLSSNGLQGSLPQNLKPLSYLQTLVLSDNNLTGPLPPDAFHSASKLKDMDLARNFISSVPTSIGDLRNLLSLNLRSNQLQVFPTAITRLTSLTSLDLSRNNLSGMIPSDIGNMVQLQSLILSGNGFSGTIPSGVGNLANLKQTLDLSANQFNGPIPFQLGNLVNLQQLYLNSNQLSGSIPSELVRLNSLQTIRLDDNNLTGQVPSLLCDVYNVKQPLSYADCIEFSGSCFTFCCSTPDSCLCVYESTDPLRCIN